ncbi:(deoxy)nucleoside triphosphate pyrophosphohydrolase [Corynebacterium falsenii]|uniref:8-oxo-dGTP diphosphatase n=1 Tax=Corynebacterium falsenii TaxID=108486 RepID=A0A418Q8U7_9CORY|nr:(deoxy)nucleoside triphosphate pyrophosphohydrolase [Corynebacterium falsenii]RIX36090.1 (deoxy)nucleoside triphosphate pyrophosphohydrolase [Corynebacterium falsenii]UBI06995.1 (deoxy)nucleoside triphosphate pyrophosphohydrolase [Corynebacterium falsenii]
MKRINVVGAVLLRDGTILAAQRGTDMSLSGLWEFPGGKIEKGETPEEALARELEEELHITAQIGDKIETTEHEYDFGIVILTTFYASLDSGEPELTEHAQVRWCTPEELETLEWAPADVPAVKKIVSEQN